MCGRSGEEAWVIGRVGGKEEGTGIMREDRGLNTKLIIVSALMPGRDEGNSDEE